MQKTAFVLAATIVLALGSATRAAVISDQMVAYWPFDEGSGNTAFDLTTNPTKHNATFTNGTGGSLPTWNATGVFGKAVDFNRSGTTVQLSNAAFANVANTSDLHPAGSSAISMSVWVNFAQLPTTTIYSIFDSSADAAIIYVDGANSSVRFKVAGTTTSNLRRLAIPLSNFTTNVWYHLVGTFSYNGSTTDMHFYVDNDESKTVSGGTGGTMTTLGTQVPTFANGGPSATTYLPGSIDDAAIWNRVLTSDERTYLQTNPAPEPGSLSLIGLCGMLLLRRRRTGAAH